MFPPRKHKQMIQDSVLGVRKISGCVPKSLTANNTVLPRQQSRSVYTAVLDK